jgi:purine-binding chemotaxis protein CheW
MKKIIREEEIDDAPEFGTKLDTDSILGMAKMEGGLKILLDINCILTSDEIKLIEKTA